MLFCAGIILKDHYGYGSYLPGEIPILPCDYENVSDPGNVVFFHNGIEIAEARWRLLRPFTVIPHSCQSSELHILGFADGLSGNYTCSVPSGSQVITSNTVSIASASKLFSALPSLPLSIERIFII